jgi:hypothetical protein
MAGVRTDGAEHEFVEVREGRGLGWIRADLAAGGLRRLWTAPVPLPQAMGRGGVGTLDLDHDLVAVVRPFKRGGAFGRLLGERYARSARVRQELDVLMALRREGVPVVTPLAAIAQKHRAFWRLRLLTELEPGALPLPAFLAAHPQQRRWAVEAAGVVVRLAFAAGLRHPDLHPDNVLCSLRGDKVRAVLVDLDRARVRKPVPESDRDAMLVRMARYLHRHARRLPVRPARTDLLRFLRALGHDAAGRRAAWERLGIRLRRALARRRLLWRRR